MGNVYQIFPARQLLDFEAELPVELPVEVRRRLFEEITGKLSAEVRANLDLSNLPGDRQSFIVGEMCAQILSACHASMRQDAKMGLL